MFIAGGYNLTFGGLALGRTEDGFNLEHSEQMDPISGDNLGAVIQDGVFRGVEAVYFDTTLLEYDLALAAAIFWNMSSGYTYGQVSPSGSQSNVGMLASTLASPLVATKITGPNASPTTITATQAILSGGFPVRLQYANRLRRVPIRMMFLPYGTGPINFFTTS